MNTDNGNAPSGAFARARLFKLALPSGANSFNDGLMLKGEWDERFLAQPFVTYLGASHRAARFRKVKCTGEQLVQKLSWHPVSERKEGQVLVYGGLTGDLSQRQTERSTSVTALVIDEDEPESLSEVFARAEAVGSAYTMFTSHSATLLKPKSRVVFYLAKEISVEEIGENWAERTSLFPVLRSHLLGGWADTSDRSAGTLIQAHNLPRHRNRAPYLTITKPGRGLVVPSLAELREEAARRGLRVSQSSRAARPKRRELEAVADPELVRMRRLVGRFLSAYGSTFDIVGALEAAGWDVISFGDIRATVVCPNSAQHSEPDARDAGCFAANPDPCIGRNFAVLSCRHAHCAELGTADLLARALLQLGLADPLGWLDRNVFQIGTNR